MNLRESPAVKYKIGINILVSFITLVSGALFLFLTVIMFNILIALASVGFLMFGFYNIYKLLKFRKFLKNIESGNCLVLQGKGCIITKDNGNTIRYALKVRIINSDGTEKTYESDTFKSKLDYKVRFSEISGVFNSLLKSKANKELFDKVLAEDFTVYVDTKNPKNYFVDISPLYAAAEQK